MHFYAEPMADSGSSVPSWRSVVRRDLGRLRRFGWRLVDESRRVRYGFEARLWNRLAGEFANSVSAIVDSTESPFDLGERDAIDSVFIRLNVQIVQAGGLVA